MTEDDLREAAAGPNCPFTYEELWDMYFGPRGPSISEIIDQLEREDEEARRRQAGELRDPNSP
jgi:hypothetical protein